MKAISLIHSFILIFRFISYNSQSRVLSSSSEISVTSPHVSSRHTRVTNVIRQRSTRVNVPSMWGWTDDAPKCTFQNIVTKGRCWGGVSCQTHDFQPLRYHIYTQDLSLHLKWNQVSTGDVIIIEYLELNLNIIHLGRNITFTFCGFT